VKRWVTLLRTRSGALGVVVPEVESNRHPFKGGGFESAWGALSACIAYHFSPRWRVCVAGCVNPVVADWRIELCSLRDEAEQIVGI
jgi:hypothetical protein